MVPESCLADEIDQQNEGRVLWTDCGIRARGKSSEAVCICRRCDRWVRSGGSSAGDEERSKAKGDRICRSKLPCQSPSRRGFEFPKSQSVRHLQGRVEVPSIQYNTSSRDLNNTTTFTSSDQDCVRLEVGWWTDFPCYNNSLHCSKHKMTEIRIRTRSGCPGEG